MKSLEALVLRETWLRETWLHAVNNVPSRCALTLARHLSTASTRVDPVLLATRKNVILCNGS